jgi:CheY-like chemotaxis protein
MTSPYSDHEGLILIVDDEPLITDLFVKSISKRGYQVLAAHDGKTALEMIRHRNMDFSLVITDMTMPEMDGVALSRELELIAPSLPVLIATGHYTDIDQLKAPSNVVGIVSKPYRTSELMETIRTILNVEELP